MVDEWWLLFIGYALSLFTLQFSFSTSTRVEIVFFALFKVEYPTQNTDFGKTG